MDKTIYKKVTITLPEDLLIKYKEYCKQRGMNLSSRIAVLLKKDFKK